MASTKLQRTPSSNGSTTINTWSFWVKRTELNDYETLYSSEISSTNVFKIGFTQNNLEILYYVGGYVFQIKTNRLFRDTSGFYNIVVTQNAGASTNTDRLKIYINGVQETSFSITNFPDLNEGAAVISASGVLQNIGTTGTEYFGGSMSHIHFIDGTAYDASAFGETDATTGEWKIKTSPSVTYGTNGFFILKDGNSVTDQSGQGNDWTVGGTLTKTEDNPSNVFATMNSLIPAPNRTLNNGNTYISGSSGNDYSYSNTATLGAASGKYYWEMQYEAAASTVNPAVGIVEYGKYEFNQNITSGTGGYVTFRFDGARQINNVQITSYWTAPTSGQIVNFALDMDNLKFWIGVNGAWYGTTGNTNGDPANGTNPSATLTVGDWTPAIRFLDGAYEFNFGNGYFGTTAVSSAGTNASGNGIFEFDCPTGYTALSTKGLNL